MWATKTLLVICLLALSACASAVSKSELESRIQQLERKLDSQGLLGLLEQVEALQREVQQLRGEVEVQTHTLQSLQKRQKDLYLDIDRRLHLLEAGSTPSPVLTPAAPAGTAPASGQVTPSTKPGAGPAPGTAAPGLKSADERKDYDQALEVLKEGRYAEASKAFQAFLGKYPRSAYADNAQYWLGEVYYVNRQFQKALAEFGKVVNNYPNSSKSADARLKTGYIQYELKEWEQAAKTLQGVVSSYPGTTTARLAQERLDRMKREGH